MSVRRVHRSCRLAGFGSGSPLLPVGVWLLGLSVAAGVVVLLGLSCL